MIFSGVLSSSFSLVAFSQIEKGQVIILKKEPMRTENTPWLTWLCSPKGEPWPVQSEPCERQDLSSLDSSIGTFVQGVQWGRSPETDTESKLRASMCIIWPICRPCDTFFGNGKCLAHLESVTSRFPDPFLVFNCSGCFVLCDCYWSCWPRGAWSEKSHLKQF